MICPVCHGNTTVPIRDDTGRIVGVCYCGECKGWGVVHCCEGDSSCNDDDNDANTQWER